MTYQLLVAAMHRSNFEICSQMNINSDAIIINQCDMHNFDIERKGDYTIKMYSFNERGVGLSRNSALSRADADIVEFADEDMIFTESYKEDVVAEFEKHPEADVILFGLNSLNRNRPLRAIDRFARVGRIEALKYGCARMAVRREKLVYNNINFSLLFGGGGKYSAGEDTLFLQDCIKAGLRVYKSPIKVADVKQDSSTWFTGYHYKYYYDKGCLLSAIFPKTSKLFALRFAIKKTPSDLSFFEKYKLLLKGIAEYKTKR